MSDREKLIDILMSKPYRHSTYEEMADYLIANGVTVQKHGRWEWLGRRNVDYGYEKHLKCSVCGWEKWYYDAKYCSNCGAKMEC